jgi:hypothetical protein
VRGDLTLLPPSRSQLPHSPSSLLPTEENSRGWILWIVINKCRCVEFSEAKAKRCPWPMGEDYPDDQIIICGGSKTSAGIVRPHILEQAPSSQFSRCNEVD